MSNFETMTVAQLKVYAEQNSVDLNGAKTKTQILAALTNMKASISSSGQTVVATQSTSPKEKRSPKSATKSDDNGIVTTATADQFKNKSFDKNENINDSKVAIHSEKNMAWMSVGRIVKGYNIVTKEASEKWITRKGIRKATPEEVANHYGL
jgi:hypothetical protein